jgi:sorbitol-specific phosphotransferase system component IIA
MRKKLSSALPLLVLLAAISGCSMMSRPPVTVTDTFCRNYEPVCLSHKDTAFTQAEVKGNEAAFKQACPVEALRGDRKCESLKELGAP